MQRLFNPTLPIPPNQALQRISQAIAFAHINYIKSANLDPVTARSCIVAMIVQPKERNFSDQRHISFTLLETYGINMVRLTLEEIENDCVLDPTTGILSFNGSPISVVYVSNKCYYRY